MSLSGGSQNTLTAHLAMKGRLPEPAPPGSGMQTWDFLYLTDQSC